MGFRWGHRNPVIHNPMEYAPRSGCRFQHYHSLWRGICDPTTQTEHSDFNATVRQSTGPGQGTNRTACIFQCIVRQVQCTFSISTSNHTAGASPFCSTISALTADQGSLSSLSMAEQMARVLEGGTPARAIIASSSWRWFSLISKSPSCSCVNASDATCTSRFLITDNVESCLFHLLSWVLGMLQRFMM